MLAEKVSENPGENAQLLSALRESLVPSGRYLVGSSGGVDSMVLLHGVLSLRKELQLVIEVAHVDHQARETSSRDRELVSRYCDAHEVVCHVIRLPQKPPKANFEAWAREERYRFFGELLKERELSFILLAHHAGDLLETFLMRLLANREPRAIQGENEKFSALRPLLGFKKQELISYARTFQVPYAEDETNEDVAFLRNKVRNVLIPFLREHFGNSVENNLLQQALNLEEELSALDDLSERFAEELSTFYFGSKEWLRRLTAILSEIPAPVGDRVVRAVFLPYSRSPMGRASARRVREFLLSSEVAIQVPPALEIRRKNGGLALFSHYRPS